MISPDTAPPRPDLTFLRHRGRPSRVLASPALADYLSGHDPHRPRRQAPAGDSSLDLSPAPTPAPASSSLDLSAPAASSSLDLSSPPAAPAPTVSSSLDLSSPSVAPTPPAASSSLDLSSPPAAPTPTVSSSLDLSPRPAPTPASQAQPARPPARAVVRDLPRATSGTTTILKPGAPTVTLNRLQSGVGALTLEAACSPAVGDLRLGAAYELTGGVSSLVQHSSGLLVAPTGSRRPVLSGQRSQFERLVVDLAQVPTLRRLAVYAFSESDAVLQWGGTLVVSTLGRARLDVALDRPPSQGVLVLLTIFNVGGELVVRAESELIAGSVRDACLAYGYDRITWLDARTPLV